MFYNKFGSLVPAGESSYLLVPIINPLLLTQPAFGEKIADKMLLVLDNPIEFNVSYDPEGERNKRDFEENLSRGSVDRQACVDTRKFTNFLRFFNGESVRLRSLQSTKISKRNSVAIIEGLKYKQVCV